MVWHRPRSPGRPWRRAHLFGRAGTGEHPRHPDLGSRISDLDEVAHNGEWKASNSEVALCGPGEALLGTGFAFTEPEINSQVTFLRALPILTSPSDGVMGQIATDAGGSAKAEIVAICLGS